MKNQHIIPKKSGGVNFTPPTYERYGDILVHDVSVFSDEIVYFASQQREKIVYDRPIVCYSGREDFFSRGNHAKRWNRLRVLLDEAVHERADEAVVDIHKVFR